MRLTLLSTLPRKTIWRSACALLLASAHASADSAGLASDTSAELAAARMATARYHDLSAALADGYVNTGVFLPGMGLHYVNPAHMDGVFEATAPELLVYWPDAQGRMRLVALEYAVPIVYPQPEGFSGSDDSWHANVGFGLWTLHAWIWLENRSGIFADTNPRLE